MGEEAGGSQGRRGEVELWMDGSWWCQPGPASKSLHPLANSAAQHSTLRRGSSRRRQDLPTSFPMALSSPPTMELSPSLLLLSWVVEFTHHPL